MPTLVRFWRGWSIARRLFAANLLFVVLLTGCLAALWVSDAGSRTYEQTSQRMLSVATTIADSPLVVAAASEPDPTSVLQPYAKAVMRDAGVDFITIMDPDGIRWTHPDPGQINKPYVGSMTQAQSGATYSETTTGTLGPSVRVVVPIKDASGDVTGMVAAGVTVSNVQVLVAARLPAVLGLAAALLLAGSLAAWALGRYLKRVTLGWGPEELGQLFAYYESVLHSVREGLILVDTRGSMVLYNDHAALLLGIDPPGPTVASVSTRTPRRATSQSPLSRARVSPPPRPGLASLGLPASLRELLQSGRIATDEVHLAADRLLVVSQRPAQTPGNPAPAGTVATLRDHTELTALAGSLSSTQTLVEALRSQTHEHANRLHAIISLIELDRTREALDFATAEHSESVLLGGEFVSSVTEPFLAALLLGKRAQADERGVILELTASGTLPTNTLDTRELVTLLGNLVDNAIEAAASASLHIESPGKESTGIESPTNESPQPTVWVDLLVADGALTLTVADNGQGLPTTDLDVLGRIGTTGKTSVAPGGRGYGIALIRRATAALGGTITGENDGGAVMTAVVPLAGLPLGPHPQGSRPAGTLPLGPTPEVRNPS
ncbi:ATP-binding protein [Arthrobacter sp. H35-MC1]|uniref:sensor histidine kinase n=1 Tax=Arthrobacter sp. H35-MC1 TaxID=3046203 RepID=UPI0024B8A046|nr:ATP-binding protein [Arthrobacter sp. H35-MC1]MDJ0318217.1 ATP-binding protein [Arthrobacter sp. H35-MC1]